jgi:uncharacterized membrane protein YagU involved in acid resistance
VKATASRRGRHAKRVTAGIVGGLIGGIFFGLLLAALGMLPVIAELVGSRSILVGLLVHGAISAIFGALFGFLLQEKLESYQGVMLLGTAYGVFWWVVGALLLMPVLLGRGPQLHAALLPPNLLSLLGHLVYGIALAVTVFVLIQAEHR